MRTGVACVLWALGLLTMRGGSASHPTRVYTTSRVPIARGTRLSAAVLTRMSDGSADHDSSRTPAAHGAGSSNGHLFSEVTEDCASVDTFGQSTFGDLMNTGPPVEPLSPEEVGGLLEELMPALPTLPTGEAKPLDTAATPLDTRGVYCSRTLNMRSIKCIGYDMDYTLVQYHVDRWEEAAYRYAKQALEAKGFPVGELQFQSDLVVRGTVIDKRLGNFVQVDRFGYVRRAIHGTRRLSRDELFKAYGRLTVDLRQTNRWVFLNTLFSLSEGSLYAQLVDKLDDGTLFTEARPPFKEAKASTYEQLHAACSKALFLAHVTSDLKAEVLANPDFFVRRDPSLPLTLMDQKDAGKTLVLITNSDWSYTRPMMQYICDSFLPEGVTWRDLFDVVICSARKPAFFAESMPLYEIVDEKSGMMLERFRLEQGKVYCGGHAKMVERFCNSEKDELLYVGDHIYTDVNMVKATMRWRTALVVQELEAELEAIAQGAEAREQLQKLIRHKDILSNLMNHLRTQMVRYEQGRPSALFTDESVGELQGIMRRLLRTMSDIDDQVAPLIDNEGAHLNSFWGYMLRAGHADKSHLMRQVEKYADIYMSRVSNMLKYTPYMYFRGSFQSLAHDQSQFESAELEKDALIASSHAMEVEPPPDAAPTPEEWAQGSPYGTVVDAPAASSTSVSEVYAHGAPSTRAVHQDTDGLSPTSSVSPPPARDTASDAPGSGDSDIRL